MPSAPHLQHPVALQFPSQGEGKLLLVGAPCGSGSSSTLSHPDQVSQLAQPMRTDDGGLPEAQPPGKLSSLAQPEIDLGHPFATGARIAHRLPVGEAALIKRTIYKEPGCERGRGDN